MFYALLSSPDELNDLKLIKKPNINCISLYRTKDNILDSESPCLLKFKDKDEIMSWIFDDIRDKKFLLIISNATIEQINQHLRKFLLVQIEDGEKIYFRFYIPQILRIFLPTCDEQQLKEFFGPVEYFVLEDEEPSNALVFSLNKGTLQTEEIPAASLIGLKTQTSE